MRIETYMMVYDQLKQMNFDKKLLSYFKELEYFYSRENSFENYPEVDYRELFSVKGKNRNSSNELESIFNRIREMAALDTNINFIPGAPSACYELCFAIAELPYEKLRSGRQIGAKGAIESLIEYWFKCFKVNEQNILLVTDWNNSDFKLHFKQILDAYNISNKRITAIIEVSETGAFIRYPF
jgi:hypothetical protein